MDHRDHQSSSQVKLQLSSNINIIKEEKFPRKSHGAGGDRVKRDEWSEGAVNALLEAYESKWVLRNRAKLKGQDWEDVARHVSSRGDSNTHTKSAKTQTQCKNKIESMKKRYRLESAMAAKNQNSCHGSCWPLYSRLDRLLRGSGASGGGGGSSGPSSPLLACGVPAAMQPLAKMAGDSSGIKNPGLVLVESGGPVMQPPTLVPLSAPMRTAVIELEQRSSQCNERDQIIKEDRVNAEEPDQLSDRNILDTDNSTSTPALYRSSNNSESKRTRSPIKSKSAQPRKKPKRQRRGDNQKVDSIAESIQWLAEAVMRSERMRMDTIRELERMRVEAEVKRGEMDLKRTEITANTQLEIARLFAYSRAEDGGGNNKNVDSSLRIGRS